MNKEKSLRELLQVLNKLNQANIDYIYGKQANILLEDKYEKEIKQIKDLINTFDFIGPKPIDKILLTNPIPTYVKEMFS